MLALIIIIFIINILNNINAHTWINIIIILIIKY